MKKTLIILTAILFSGAFPLLAQNPSPEIKAYYFHATRRCPTCQAVEKVSKEYIAEKHKEKVEFIAVNRDRDENKALIEKYGVSGQTLLLVKGEESIDLTSTAFMYARTKPEKLEEKIASAVNSLL